MVPRPSTPSTVLACTGVTLTAVALLLTWLVPGVPAGLFAVVLATIGMIVACVGFARSRRDMLRPAEPPAAQLSEHDRAALAALTDADRDEMAALGFDLTGLPTPDATPATPMTHGEYLLTVDTVQTSDDGWVRITASDGSRIEYPLVDAEQPPPVGDPIDPDTGILPDAAAAWHREAGARPAKPPKREEPLSAVGTNGRFTRCPSCQCQVLRRAMHVHRCGQQSLVTFPPTRSGE